MTTIGTDISPHRAARVAGIGLLAMAALSIFAQFFVSESLIVSGNAAATAENVAGNESLFRLGAAAWPVVAVLDVVVALALYVVFRPVNRSLSLLSGWLRLAYTAIFAAGTFNLLTALRLFDGAGYLTTVPAGQRDAQALLALDSFQNGWMMGFVLFGAHLGILGYLAYRSGYVPKVLGALLLLAGASYLLDSILTILVTGYEGPVAVAVAVPEFIGEMALAVWLVIKGARVPGISPGETVSSDARASGQIEPQAMAGPGA